ncbi:sigma-54-dependent transcriptional regulator [Acidobacteriota bacterium]
MNKANILVVEDDPLQRRLIRENLENVGYILFDVSNGVDALEVVNSYPIDIAVLDYKLKGETGVELVEKIIKINPLITPIIVTAFANVENAVDALKKGAYDYIVKPIDFPKFLLVLERALERQNLRKEISVLKNTIGEKFSFKNIVATSPEMEEVTSLMTKAAQSEATTLILGETGTGKDLVAKTIHYSSKRENGPFLSVNIPSLPESLVESELFGAEKGAFTGANARQIGKFEAADGGTLFLDEIGDLNQGLQVKILRFLQEKEFFRLGSAKTIKANVRIIAATNKDLEQLVDNGQFRSDLFYRLNVLQIHVPPLRNRKGDIPPLVDLIIRRLGKKEGKSITGVSSEAMDRLVKYHYPGNIRELENILERAVIFCDGEFISQKDLPLFISDPEDIGKESSSNTLTSKIRSMEIIEIKKALQSSHGIKSRAAKTLGITERMLSYKIKSYNITIPKL